MRGNGRGWGQHAANGLGTRIFLRGGNGVKHLSPCHSLLTSLQPGTSQHCETMDTGWFVYSPSFVGMAQAELAWVPGSGHR